LEEETVAAVVLGPSDDIKEGDEVRSTGRIIEIPVGDALIGRVIDPLGNPMCVYGMKDDFGHRFLLRVDRSPWDRKRYDQRLSLARGSGIREVVLLKDVGDAGFFVEGAAGALAGTRYIEISGFKAAALRPVQVDEAASLLKLIIERLPKQ
jgi:hypothetical protein